MKAPEIPSAAVDLTNCDREPIHIPGSIQPHGAMLVCDANGQQITHVSANLGDFIKQDALSLPGKMLQDAVGIQTSHDLRNAAAKTGGAEIPAIVLDVDVGGHGRNVDIAVHRYKNRLFVEMVERPSGDKSAQDALDLTQSLVRRIGLETDVAGIAASGARLVRAMLGYDRVMVYRFLHNGAGRVIAEAKNTALCSFMGQHFPASDIPYQARRLYLLNTIRLISDTHYAPMPLLPHLREGEEPIDMSFAQLRSVSPIHCEYLQNMGVSASLSISIIVDGELWGLISCHHDEPKTISMPLRVGAELFGQYFSLQIAVAQRRAELLASNLARERLDNLISTLKPDESVGARLRNHLADFSDIVTNDGAALWIEGYWTTLGSVPSPEDLNALRDFLTGITQGVVWHSDEMQIHIPGVEAFASVAAGVLAIPISTVTHDVLVLFRNEESYDVKWAGEPVKTVVQGPAGDRLTPRGSFDTWLEEVKGRSTPWTMEELAVATTVRNHLRDIVLHHSETTAEELARTEHHRRILNDELNHRVKNIIALVKSIAAQTGAHAATVDDYSKSLEGRLRALAYAHDQSLSSGSGGDLATLIEAEASLHRYGLSKDRVVASGPTVGLNDRTFGVLALLLHEMMTNAAKYGALSIAEGRLTIEWSLDEAGDCVLQWAERGGPMVIEPSRAGFGSKLIRSTLTYDLGGTADVRYPPGGVEATFVIPGRHLKEHVAVEASVAPAFAGGKPLEGMIVLLVEDQALIAMDTEETLRKLGAENVVATPDTRGAQAAIEQFDFDYAVLDFNLGEEMSTSVADTLTGRSIPFVFATGYGDSVMIPERFRSVPVVRKPIGMSALGDRVMLTRSPTANS